MVRQHLEGVQGGDHGGHEPAVHDHIEIDYICEMLNKTINQDVNYVVAFYVFNFYLVFIGILVYF